MLNKVIAIILINLVYYSLGQNCPDAEIIAPCKCMDQKTIDSYKYNRYSDESLELGVNCIGTDNYIYLSKVFEEIDEKYEGSKEFGHLNIKYDGMTELKENTFHNSTFENLILINRCENLETIHENAFTETLKVTKQLSIRFNPKLMGNSLFKVLNKFTAVESIELYQNNLTEIPSEAFANDQPHLRKIYILDPSIKTLGKSAFKGLANIKQITILLTQIDFIPDFAFEIQESSKYPLYIKLGYNNNLGSHSFAQNAFANIGRPTILDFGIKNTLDSNEFSYLNSSVFLSFLQADPLNKINMHGNRHFDCTSCKNYWIKSNNLIDRMVWLKCSNGLNLDDNNNFARCSR